MGMRARALRLIASARMASGPARVAAALALVLVAGCGPDLPPPDAPAKVRWLDQNWSDGDRYWFHHATQGTSTLPIPYDWFVALEEPRLSLWGPAPLFARDAYLTRFGFIPSPGPDPAAARAAGYGAEIAGEALGAYGQTLDAVNPDGLPVGFARTRAYPDPTTGRMLPDQIGFTCAACHTGQITYGGVGLRIDGANAGVNLDKLTEALGVALLYTDFLPQRFERFATRVLGPGAPADKRQALKEDLRATLARLKAANDRVKPAAAGGVEEGFARLDALTRIGNQVFAVNLLNSTAPGFDPVVNYAPITAPVKFPHIWDTPWMDWVQYDGSILKPIIRNAGEAMGVAAKVNMTGGEHAWSSSVDVVNLARMEALIAGPQNPLTPAPGGEVAGFQGLRAPKWPEDVLGPIDPIKRDQGARLYAELCQGCHLPPVNDPGQALFDPRHWTAPNDQGASYLKVALIPQEEVGTDPAQETILRTREVVVPAALGIEPGRTLPGGVICFDEPTAPVTTTTFAQALASAVQSVVTAAFKRAGPDASMIEARTNDRPNCVQAKAVYKARPLDGIWAVPPYLHNGSVPTLQALLGSKPERDRLSRFCLGSRAYDPRKVGLVADCGPGTFAFKTDTPGNSNRGHEFRDGAIGRDGVIGRALSEDERGALIEFLKSL